MTESASHQSLTSTGTSPSKGRPLPDAKQWEAVQKKTFTKWVNNQLRKAAGSPVSPSAPAVELVEDLTLDFANGVKLLRLLEVIGDVSLGRYYLTPKLRVQQCENVNKALDFIKQRGVLLTNIGAEDLVDKNEKLVLGLVWTLILRFSIAEISEEGKTAKDGLLLWCQRKTAGYGGVSVRDFTYSWADGLAFCALIHRHRPDLLDYQALDKSQKKKNILLAFEVAEKHLGIPRLLDVEDLTDLVKPDERSVMTYVAQYFHAFSALDKIVVAGRRIGKFALMIKAAWEMQNDYEKRAQQLLTSIAETTDKWSEAPFDDTYADARQQSVEFQQYKNSSKREWVSEKRELDSLLSNINTKLRTYNLTLYSPPHGLASDDLDSAWKELIDAEAVRRKSINDKIQQIKDKLRHVYSDYANAFESALSKISKKLGLLTGDLEYQLEQVKSLSNELSQQESNVEKIRDADVNCIEAGIDETDREFTVFSLDDLVFDLSIVKQAIQKKHSFVENQMIARQVTNLTPQQLEEFETTFKAFDRDQKNQLTLFEFKACLNAFGKDYGEEVTEVFAKAAQGADVISFEQFLQFMVSITEDRTTVEQLLQSYKDIARGKQFITEDDMRAVQIPIEQIEYLKSVMPHFAGSPGGFDFTAYLKDVFE